MELSPKFLGLAINDDGVIYNFKYMPFTQSSKILDEEGFLISELKRFGWFKLNFKLFTNNKEYMFKCRLTNHELIAQDGKVFKAKASSSFYDGDQQVTNLEYNNKIGKYLVLDINSKEHKTALLIASCLMAVRYMHGG